MQRLSLILWIMQGYVYVFTNTGWQPKMIVHIFTSSILNDIKEFYCHLRLLARGVSNKKQSPKPSSCSQQPATQGGATWKAPYQAQPAQIIRTRMCWNWSLRGIPVWKTSHHLGSNHVESGETKNTKKRVLLIDKWLLCRFGSSCSGQLLAYW